MAKATAVNNDNLAFVTLGNGTIYLGVLEEGKIIDAMKTVEGSLSRAKLDSYVKLRNLGELQTVQFSAVTDYTTRPLDAKEQALFEFVSGMFEMAKKQAKALAENNTYDQLYAGK